MARRAAITLGGGYYDLRGITVEGLWGLNFGNGLEGQNTSSLFFAVGPNDEEDGVYGRIIATSGD